MKKRNLLIVISFIILLLIGIVIVIVVFNRQKYYKTQEKFVMPADLDFADNKLLYGNWNSRKLEIYNNEELKLSFEDVYEKTIKFYSDNLISVCYLKEDDYICTDSDYAFIDSKLYISADTYISKVSEVILDGNSLKLKYKYNNQEYSLLYFERE